MDLAVSTASTTTSGCFRARHHRHQLEWLQGIGEKCTLDNPPVDFARVEYMEVTNGRDCYIVRSALNGDKSSVSYHLFPGRLTGLPIRMSPISRGL